MPVVRTGPRGGKYIVSRGRKVYLSTMPKKTQRKVKRDSPKRKIRKNKFG